MKVMKNISVVLISVLVMFLTMGTHISEMQCSKGQSIFLGQEVPNCKINKKISCNNDVEKMSCCKKKEIEESCCPTTDGCEKETELLQFTFETIVEKKQKITDCKEISIFEITQNNIFELSSNNNFIIYYKSESPPLLTKPILPEIQSFLL
jgi:hypothetical protein